MADLDIRFTTTTDGVSIAYGSYGSGPVLLMPPVWVSHLELDWETYDQTRLLAEQLGSHFRVITWDSRGLGLSQRNVEEVSFETRMLDYEAVAAASGADEFSILASSGGGPSSIRFAYENPERVNRLAFFGSFAGYVEGGARKELLELTRVNWGVTTLEIARRFSPDLRVTRERLEEMSRVQLESATAEMAVAYLEFDNDQRSILGGVSVPTLVVHLREDQMVSVDFGRELASGIPGARLLVLEGRNHGVVTQEEAKRIVAPILEFLLDGEEPNSEPVPSAFQTIMFTDLESSTALTQRVGDEAAQEILRGHNTTVRAALEAHGGREVKHTGDGIMASFGSAVSAVAAALQIQRDLAGGEIRVRIGINAGEPIAEDDDLFGTAVQLAARLTDRAEPGQVLVSRVVADLCAGKTFKFTSLGEASLKGFDEPVALFEVRV